MNRLIKRTCLAFFLCANLAHGQTPRYVSTNGAHTAPYTSWSTAATNIDSAVNWANTNNAGDTVWISNGVHWLTATVTISNTIVKGFSGNYSDVIVNGNGAVGCFDLINSNAFLAALTVTNGWRSGIGGGIKVWGTNGGGTVSNCLITGCWGLTNGGVAIECDGGIMQDCVIAFNTASKQSGGLWVNAVAPVTTRVAVVKNCIIRNNVTTNAATADGGGGVRMKKTGTMINCQIVSNVNVTASTYPFGGGIQISDEANLLLAISNCVISGNTAGYAGGVSLMAVPSAKLYNCLIKDNASQGGGGGGVLISSKTNELFNCTIVNNTDGGSESMGGGIGKSSGGTPGAMVYNCIVYSNYYTADPGSAVKQNFGGYSWYVTFVNSCTTPNPWAGTQSTGVNTIVTYPKFVDPAGDYRLQADSPCINVGINQSWMNGAVDLDGRHRLDRFRRQVDMGAYEYLLRGTMVGFY